MCDAYAYGYDAQEDQFGDLVSKGTIGPTKVVRTALQDAASIAGLITTTEAMVAEKSYRRILVMSEVRRQRLELAI
jgi:chaperonin GroEL